MCAASKSTLGSDDALCEGEIGARMRFLKDILGRDKKRTPHTFNDEFMMSSIFFVIKPLSMRIYNPIVVIV